MGKTMKRKMTSLNLIGLFYSTRYLGVAHSSSGEEVLEVALTPPSLGVKVVQLEDKLKGRSVMWLDMIRVYGRFRI